jgi:DNA-binding NtrC family response regulator
MRKILVVESDVRDAERFQSFLAIEDFEMVLCESGAAAERVITAERKDEFAAAITLWEIPGPPFGFSLLARCRQLWPDVPVIVVSGMLDAVLAMRAFALGARDFLEKPLESERVKSCLVSLFADLDSFSPLIDGLRQTIIGQSPALLSALKQMAKLIPHADTRALFIGESGTGKELFAQAIHDLGPRSGAPWIAVNVGEIPETLVESALFGHEKGSFTGATARHVGFLEEVGNGTLFLDEVGEIDLSLQVKLLRVIQENQFRRLGGDKSLPFEGRLVFATNRDLAAAIRQGAFRQDLFHRIAEKTIHIPPLRERKGDIEVLLSHFLDAYRGERQVDFARETKTILRSYPFPGNVRELQNLVRAALIDCEGDTILPQDLPWSNMAAFLAPESEVAAQPSTQDESRLDSAYQELFAEAAKSLPSNWLQMPYRETAQLLERAFDRIYFRHLYDRARGNVTQSAAAAGIDKKTFYKRWEASGLPPLKVRVEDGDG